MRRVFKTKLLLVPGLLMVVMLAACSSAAAPATVPDVAVEPEPVAAPELAARPVVEPELVAPPVAVITPTPVPAAAPEPTPTPVVSTGYVGRRGGTLTIAAFADIPHRDVHQEAQETLTSLGPGLAYSRLLRLRSGPEVDQPSLLLQCDLCQSWRLKEDFSYEFQLRPEVYWQNVAPVNGRPLVAADLVYSYARMQTPGWPGHDLFSDRGIGRIEATGPHTLQVGLEFLDSDALLALADGHSKIVAREVVEQYGDLKNSPVVGTGPWIWEETIPGEGTRLIRNPGYFEANLPFLDELMVKVVKSAVPTGAGAVDQIAAYKAGLVDLLPVSPEDWQRFYGSELEFDTALSHQAGSGVLLSLNGRKSPLDQLVVRQSILRSLDPWEYVDIIWSGQGSVGVGMPVVSPEWQLSRRELRDRYFANPSEARDVLVYQGVPIPLDLELILSDSGDIYRQLAERVADNLQSAGFNANVRALHPAHFNEVLLGSERDYHLALGPVPPVPTTNGFLFTMLHSGGPGNLAGHQDRRLDAMIEAQAGEFDAELRREQLLDIQRHVLEQGYLFSPVSSSYRWVYDWDLKSFYPNNSLSEYSYWSRVWLER